MTNAGDRVSTYSEISGEEAPGGLRVGDALDAEGLRGEAAAELVAVALALDGLAGLFQSPGEFFEDLVSMRRRARAQPGRRLVINTTSRSAATIHQNGWMPVEVTRRRRGAGVASSS